MLVWIQSSRTTLTPSKRAIIRTWRRRGWTCSGRPWAPPWLTNLIKNVQHYYTAFLGRAEAIPDTWQDVLLDYSHGSCQLCCLLKSFKRNFCFRVSHHMLVLFETPYERYETLWSLQRAPASPPQFSSCVDPPFNIHSGSTQFNHLSRIFIIYVIHVLFAGGDVHRRWAKLTLQRALLPLVTS